MLVNSCPRKGLTNTNCVRFDNAMLTTVSPNVQYVHQHKEMFITLDIGVTLSILNNMSSKISDCHVKQHR